MLGWVIDEVAGIQRGKKVHAGASCRHKDGYLSGMTDPILVLPIFLYLRIAQNPDIGAENHLTRERQRLGGFTGDVALHFGNDLACPGTTKDELATPRNRHFVEIAAHAYWLSR